MLHKWIRRWREREQPLLAMLRGVPLFQNLSFGDMREVADLLQTKPYAIGEVVFDQGTHGQGVYIVLSGQVEIFQTDDQDGTQILLARSDAGSFFGETSLLDDAPRTARAVVSLEAELALFPRSALLSLAEHRPHLSVKIALQLSQIIAERLRRTNRGLREARDKVDAAQRTQAKETS